jgi:GNAT superfamily N-acetyltransferase
MASGSPNSLDGGRSRFEGSFTAPVPISLLVTGALRASLPWVAVAAGIEIVPIASGEFERVLPLIADYQRFYEVEEIDEERNRAFFRRFLAPSDDGLLLGARQDGEIVGFACLYWHLSSLSAAETVLMNDLYVSEWARGRGAGRALIEASADVARERGASCLEWATAPSNVVAQRLYDSTGAKRSEWIQYELEL